MLVFLVFNNSLIDRKHLLKIMSRLMTYPLFSFHISKHWMWVKLNLFKEGLIRDRIDYQRSGFHIVLLQYENIKWTMTLNEGRLEHQTITKHFVGSCPVNWNAYEVLKYVLTIFLSSSWKQIVRRELIGGGNDLKSPSMQLFPGIMCNSVNQTNTSIKMFFDSRINQNIYYNRSSLINLSGVCT